MTSERANEIERKVIYKHIDNIMMDLEKCEDSNIVFNIGRRIGFMQYDLKRELEKEIKQPTE